jgi:uncharacterized protein Yka (UPF0111/DUF47 family)
VGWLPRLRCNSGNCNGCAVRAPKLHWFLPDAPDVLRLLIEQGRVTLEGMTAFDRWAADGSNDEADQVRRSEHDADHARRDVIAGLRKAFTTPIEPEDLFELSERLDQVLNQSKNIVRESEVLDLRPDPPMAEMAHHLLAGVLHVTDAFPHLAADRDVATAEADKAIREQRAIERIYRDSMSALLQEDDLKKVTGYRELYRRFSRTGNSMEQVADRIWYAVVKLG